MIADGLIRRLWTRGNDRTTVQVHQRHDGRYRVVQLERIAESSRYREARGETCDDYRDALRFAEEWFATSTSGIAASHEGTR